MNLGIEDNCQEHCCWSVLTKVSRDKVVMINRPRICLEDAEKDGHIGEDPTAA